MFREEFLAALDQAQEVLAAECCRDGKVKRADALQHLLEAISRPPIAEDSVAVADLVVAVGYVCLDSPTWEVLCESWEASREAVDELKRGDVTRHRVAIINDISMFYCAGHHVLWLADQARQEQVPVQRLAAYWGGVTPHVARYRVNVHRTTVV